MEIDALYKSEMVKVLAREQMSALVYSYEFEEVPFWCPVGETSKTTSALLDEVAEAVDYFNSREDPNSEQFRGSLRRMRRAFVLRSCIGEGIGLSNDSCIAELERFFHSKFSLSSIDMEPLAFDMEELKSKHVSLRGYSVSQLRETFNVFAALLYVDKLVESTKSVDGRYSGGFIDVLEIKQLHRYLADGLIPDGNTPAGKFSKAVRGTTYDGVEYLYAGPDEIRPRLGALLERYWPLVMYLTENPGSLKTRERVEATVKLVAYFVYEFLDIHPFSDGNGRTARILCAMTLRLLVPFDCPIYNIYAETTHDDYLRALVVVQKRGDRKPREFGAMIAESLYHGCVELLHQLDGTIVSSPSTKLLKDLTTPPVAAEAGGDANSGLENVGTSPDGWRPFVGSTYNILREMNRACSAGTKKGSLADEVVRPRNGDANNHYN